MKEWLIATLLSGLAIFAPIQASVFAVGALIFADLIIGVLAARKRGESITSAGLRRTITKMFAYESALILGFVVEKYLAADVIPIAKLVAGMIGVTELKSVFENLDVISGNSIFKSLIQKLGSKNDTEEK